MIFKRNYPNGYEETCDFNNLENEYPDTPASTFKLVKRLFERGFLTKQDVLDILDSRYEFQVE